MDIRRAILDGIAMAAIFNGAVAAFVLIDPRFFFDSYPKGCLLYTSDAADDIALV